MDVHMRQAGIHFLIQQCSQGNARGLARMAELQHSATGARGRRSIKEDIAHNVFQTPYQVRAGLLRAWNVQCRSASVAVWQPSFRVEGTRLERPTGHKL